MKFNKTQIARRTLQISVVVVILMIPVVSRYTNYLSAHELDAKLEKWNGTLHGEALGLVDFGLRSLPDGELERVGKMQRNRRRILQYTQGLRGGAWSLEVAGVSMTDPLAVVENVAASKTVSAPLLIGLLIPLAATLLLGRVFCSWLCPVGLLLELTDKLRSALAFLEIRSRNLRFPRSFKYLILGAGLVLAALTAAPVLGYVYPPAIMSRELHDFVLALFDRAEFGKLDLAVTGFSVMALSIVAIVLFELFVSRRWWCRYVCPGGALYSTVGWARPVGVKLKSEACTSCTACIPACPMGLNPMQNKMGLECDNCGVCIASCGDDALAYGLLMPGVETKMRPVRGSWEGQTMKGTRPASTAALAITLTLFMATPALAHHILGIPHYSYGEDYPQTPVLTYEVEAGSYDVKVTGYPGELEPGDQSSLYVYITDKDSGVPFNGEVSVKVVKRNTFAADETVYGPLSAGLDESVYKFYPRFDDEADYVAELSFGEPDHPWVIDLPMVVGEPSSPWVPLAGCAAGVMVLAVGLRAVLIKRRRRGRLQRTEATHSARGQAQEALP